MTNLTTFVQVRWYSALSMMRSLLKNRNAISFNCLANRSALSPDILVIIENSMFWTRLNNITIILEPINDLIRVAESDDCRLSDYLFYFLCLGKRITDWRESDLGKESLNIYFRRFWPELNIDLLLAAYVSNYVTYKSPVIG